MCLKCAQHEMFNAEAELMVAWRIPARLVAIDDMWRVGRVLQYG